MNPTVKKTLKKIKMYNNVCRIVKAKQTYLYTPYFYVNKDGNIVKDKMTSDIQWLEKISVSSYNREMAYKDAMVLIKSFYPDNWDKVKFSRHGKIAC